MQVGDVVRNHLNSFHYLYLDADYLRANAQLPRMAGNFCGTQLSRSAVLLYVLSLEGLVNRALHAFLPEHLRTFVMERERKLSLEDKWLLLPLLLEQRTFERGREPWASFVELIRMRDDYVHPKHDRVSYMHLTAPGQIEPLDWNRVPAGSGIKEADLVYRQTGLPKDPYALLPEHLDIVKGAVDAIVTGLDELLCGRLTKDNWLHSDQLEVVHGPTLTHE